MKSMIAVLLACGAASAQSDPSALQSAFAKKNNGWIAYEVPMVEGAGAPCCFVERQRELAGKGCDLDGRTWNFGTNSRDNGSSQTLTVYWHVADGRPDRVRAMAASCPVTSRTEIMHLSSIEAAASVKRLADWSADPARPGDDAGNALAALAYHADASATRQLNDLAAVQRPRELREQALFWLGQTRGREGADIVERVARRDADPKIREHAVFALAQAQVTDAYARVHAIASSDADAHVRSQALFWMAQSNDAHARADILAALRRETSEDVREEAVFALSQLDDETADAALIDVVRGDYPRKVKEKALFWLGQSGSQRALDFIDEVLAQRSNPTS